MKRLALYILATAAALSVSAAPNTTANHLWVTNKIEEIVPRKIEAAAIERINRNQMTAADTIATIKQTVNEILRKVNARSHTTTDVTRLSFPFRCTNALGDFIIAVADTDDGLTLDIESNETTGESGFSSLPLTFYKDGLFYSYNVARDSDGWTLDVDYGLTTTNARQIVAMPCTISQDGAEFYLDLENSETEGITIDINRKEN